MTTSSKSWFDIDRKGLAKLLERKGGKAWVAYELLQNSFDEDGCTQVSIEVTAIDGKPEAWVIVKDDVPNGFSDLTHAFTLFAESKKKGDPTKRGRFNLGEKLVLACCSEATIKTTTGAFSFDANGRKALKVRTDVGSEFCGILRITREELAWLHNDIRRVLPPRSVKTTFNGIEIPPREPIATFEAKLPTEIGDDDGVLRRTIRTTTISVYEVLPGEPVSLYEMGIPVVELPEDKFHVSIDQKIPLSIDREAVTPAFLRQVRALVLNNVHDKLTPDDMSSAWVTEATTDKQIEPQAVNAMLDARFGKKRVVYDPSDPEANGRAMAAGFTVISGRSLPRETWAVVKENGLALAAGKVTPGQFLRTSPDGIEMKEIKLDDYTDGMLKLAIFYKKMAAALLDCMISVTVISDLRHPYSAAFGGNELTLNKVRLGTDFFEEGAQARQIELGIHEFAHKRVANHLSDEFHEECCRLGAKLAILVSEGKFKLTIEPF